MVNVGIWFADKTDEKKQRAEQRELCRIAVMEGNSRERARAENIYVDHILERKKIDAVKKVADESIVRVIDLK